MMSANAFNALLKTLEEPPSYVIFILATTEPHKIPITILSRCQRYDFRRISIDTISNRLMELMDKEQVDVEEKAIRYVAKAADGSMRDALSLLDQCIAFYLGKRLTYDHVLEVLGAVDTEVFSRLLRRILDEDVAGAISQLDDALARVSSVRSAIGAYQNRLDYAVTSLDETSENMTAALSRIQDVDMALEMTEYTKQNVLQQSAISVLSQANDQPQQVLQLLQ